MNIIVKEILEKLENKGYQAYIVGGYVRDFLLGIKSIDIDICTDAKIEDIKQLFNLENIKSEYGSIHFQVNEFHITITTF